MDMPRTADVRHTLALLETTPATALASDDAIDLHALKERFGFPAAVPLLPPLPPAPQPPVVPAAPREDDPRYEAVLTTMDRLFSARRIKKQQAALDRFERDRKAWGENRTNALAHFEMARKRHAREVEALQTSYASALDEWRLAFAAYLHAMGGAAGDGV